MRLADFNGARPSQNLSAPLQDSYGQASLRGARTRLGELLYRLLVSGVPNLVSTGQLPHPCLDDGGRLTMERRRERARLG